jgi:hypothetical protein
MSLRWDARFKDHYLKVYTLHEQLASKTRVRQYVRRWLSWVNGGLATLAHHLEDHLDDLTKSADEFASKVLDSRSLAALVDCFQKSLSPCPEVD